MNSPPARRPPLKTEDVRRLLTAIDAHLSYDPDAHPTELDGYSEVAAAVGHELPKLVTAPAYTATDEEWEDAAPGEKREYPPMSSEVKKQLTKAGYPPLDEEKAKTCPHEVWLLRKGTSPVELYCPDCGMEKAKPYE